MRDQYGLPEGYDAWRLSPPSYYEYDGDIPEYFLEAKYDDYVADYEGEDDEDPDEWEDDHVLRTGPLPYSDWYDNYYDNLREEYAECRRVEMIEAKYDL